MIFSFNGEAGQSNYQSLVHFSFTLYNKTKKTNTTMSQYFQNLTEKL